jgi:tetratricopeptide (TPR) repeat protein
MTGTMTRSVSGLLIVVLVLACGGRAQTGARPTIDQLRERAADRPDDPDAQRELAFGEMLMQNGDPDRVEAQLQRALALAEGDERLLYLSAVRAELSGHPGSALSFYLEALDAAAVSEHGMAPWVGEAAAQGVESLSDVAPGWADRAHERLSALFAEPRNIGPAARHIVGRTLVEIAFRRGGIEEVGRLATDAGCLTEVRSAGPFGPFELLGFDRRHAPETDQTLADAYDLGPTRGRRETRELGSRGCTLHLGGGPVMSGGTTYVEGHVEIPRDGDYVVRLETPNSVELFVDRASAARLDHRVDPLVRTTLHRMRLTAGRHAILAKITTRHPNPVISIAVTDDLGRSPSAARASAPARGEIEAGASLGRPRGDGVFEAYLRAQVAMARGDIVGARRALAGELPERGASPAILQLASVVAMSDPLRPSDMRRDAARRYLRTARRRDGSAWYPVVQLAQLDAADGRLLAALQMLDGAHERWPEVLAIPMTRADLLLARGWDAQAERTVRVAREMVPDSCAPLGGAMAAAERRLRYDEMRSLVDAVVACDARSAARFSFATRTRDWETASAELERLTRLEPPQSRLALVSSELGVARGRGDEAAIERILGELAELSPRSVTTPVERADRRLAQGDVEGARSTLDDAIRAEPSTLTELYRLSRAIGGDFPLASHRLDGAATIRAFEASGRSYDQPEVLVLDYTVVRIFEDGSTLELTHNIWKVQADEVLDDRGEYTPPPGAELLTLHTIKADGRRLEADPIEGKDSISLPNLAPGDYVEYEYVSAGEPILAFPGGFLGDRFYFRSFETPYDLSQLTLVMPEEMEPLVDPRGPAPATEETVEDGLRVLRFTVRESRPLPVEPMSVSPNEYLPSINVGIGASWPLFIDSLRDALADQDVRDPDARRLVSRLLRNSRRAPIRRRAEILYRWVLDNVEDTNDVFGLAPAMLADRTGNRARMLHYLYGLAGIHSRLVVARTLATDATDSELPDPETYQHLLVMLGDGEGAVFLSTVDRGAPFGYVPPELRTQPALVLAEGGDAVEISDAEVGFDRRTVDVDVTLDASGSATAEVVETFRGAPAIAWRRDLESIPTAMLEQRFEEGYVARIVPGATLSSLRVSGREEVDEPLVFRYAFEVGELGQVQSGRRRIPMLYPTVLAPVYTRLAERTTTELVAPGVDVDVTMRIRVTGGITLPEAPREQRLAGPGGSSFRVHGTRRDGVLSSFRQIRVPVMRVSVADYPAFARFCLAVDEAEARELTVGRQ